MKISPERKSALLSKYTSRRNKVWLAITWKQDGVFINWSYTGEIDDSRMLFQFEENGPWVAAKSYEDDIKPKLKFNRPKKVKDVTSQQP